MLISDLLTQVRSSRTLSREDAQKMQRFLYRGETLRSDDIDMMLALDEVAHRHDPAWKDLLCKAVVDFIVHQEKPSGSMNRDKSDWLLQRVAHGGSIGPASQLAVLTAVLAASRSCPDELQVFALQEAKRTGIGTGSRAGLREAQPLRRAGGL
ncbi:hypothetical protein [Faunimonas pinastri]|nr:hypothetical protein [Faunimonas pinastri]